MVTSGESHPEVHLLLHDGECGLCDRLVRFVVARDRAGRFRPEPLQGEAARAALRRIGAPAPALDTVLVIADHATAPRLLARSDAALFVLSRLPAPWRWLALARALPQPLRDRAYDLVARHRRRLFPARCTRRPPP